MYVGFHATMQQAFYLNNGQRKKQGSAAVRHAWETNKKQAKQAVKTQSQVKKQRWSMGCGVEAKANHIGVHEK